MDEKPFWERKSLEELTAEEWEALCDGCGRCCLYKFRDADSGEVLYTDVACRLLDLNLCRCADYANRFALEPGCIRLDAAGVRLLDWLPESCAYRRVALGRPLPDWHPLRSGDPYSTLRTGHSVAGWALSGRDVPEEVVEDRLLPPGITGPEEE